MLFSGQRSVGTCLPGAHRMLPSILSRILVPRVVHARVPSRFATQMGNGRRARSSAEFSVRLRGMCFLLLALVYARPYYLTDLFFFAAYPHVCAFAGDSSRE